LIAKLKNINNDEINKSKKINLADEGYIKAQLNSEKDKEDFIKNWFYVVDDILYIKKNRNDFFYTHSIPLCSIYAVQPLLFNRFEICSLYIIIKCQSDSEEMYEKWYNVLTKKINEKKNQFEINSILEEYIVETKKKYFKTEESINYNNLYNNIKNNNKINEEKKNNLIINVEVYNEFDKINESIDNDNNCSTENNNNENENENNLDQKNKNVLEELKTKLDIKDNKENIQENIQENNANNENNVADCNINKNQNEENNDFLIEIFKNLYTTLNNKFDIKKSEFNKKLKEFEEKFLEKELKKGEDISKDFFPIYEDKVLVNKDEFQQICESSLKVVKLEEEILELNKKLLKSTVNLQLTPVLMEQLNTLKKQNTEISETIKFKDEKIAHLIQNGSNLDEKLKVKSLETKNVELEKFIKLIDLNVQDLSNKLQQKNTELSNIKNDINNNNNELKTYKERDKILLDFIKNKNYSEVEKLLSTEPTDENLIKRSGSKMGFFMKRKTMDLKKEKHDSKNEKTEEEDKEKLEKEKLEKEKIEKERLEKLEKEKHDKKFFNLLKLSPYFNKKNDNTEKSTPVIIHDSSINIKEKNLLNKN
jgi:hypothetical protein